MDEELGLNQSKESYGEMESKLEGWSKWDGGMEEAMERRERE